MVTNEVVLIICFQVWRITRDAEDCAGCKTAGYQSNKDAEAEMVAKGTHSSIFMLPKDESLRNQGLHNISRDTDEK